MKTPYDDIIRLPHHVSRKHPRMPMRDRAAQFAPFSALTDCGAALDETARITVPKRELDAQEADVLDRRLALLRARQEEHPSVTVEYFVPDARKEGGTYVAATGAVKRISAADRRLVMEDGRVISLDDIDSLEIATDITGGESYD